MLEFLKYYVKYNKSENLSKLFFMPVGIILFEINQALNIYSGFDASFATLITFSFLIGASVNEYRGELIKRSALVPIKRKELYIAKILYILLPAYIYSIFLQTYFLVFAGVGNDYLQILFTGKFYIIFFLLIFTISDLFNTILKWKYLLIFLVPLIVLIMNVVSMYVFVHYFEQFNTGFFIILEVLFLILLIPTLFLLYYFFTKRTDYLK